MIYRSNHNGIISEFTIPTKKQKGIVILLAGMPSVPRQDKLLESLAMNGYVAIFPRYRGTWESTGNFLGHSPVIDIEELCKKILKDKKLTELYAGEKFSLTTNNIIAIGTSFGGTIALCSAKFPFIKKVLAFSPVVNWNNYAGAKTKDEFEHLHKFCNMAFSKAYRFSKIGWKKFQSGKLFNSPVDFDQNDRNKITVISDPEDQVTSIDQIENYTIKNKINFKKINGFGHISFSKFPIKKIIGYIEK